MKENIAKAPSGRTTRKPVGFRNRLEVINKDPSRVYRVINPQQAGGRLEDFLDAGYRIENWNEHRVSNRIEGQSSTDNSVPLGANVQGVLVSIEKEFYDQDQAAKLARIKQTEAGLKQNKSHDYGDLEISS